MKFGGLTIGEWLLSFALATAMVSVFILCLAVEKVGRVWQRWGYRHG